MGPAWGSGRVAAPAKVSGVVCFCVILFLFVCVCVCAACVCLHVSACVVGMCFLLGAAGSGWDWHTAARRLLRLGCDGLSSGQRGSPLAKRGKARSLLFPGILETFRPQGNVVLGA